MAAATRLVLDGNAARDHAATRKLVDVAAPRRSLLLTKATGSQHGGGPTLTTSSDTYRRLLQWIANGAQLDARPAGEPPAPAAAAAEATGPRRPRVRAPSAAAARPRAARAGRRPRPPPQSPKLRRRPRRPRPPARPPPPAPAAAALAPQAIALHAELVRACQPCHREGGPAA